MIISLKKFVLLAAIISILAPVNKLDANENSEGIITAANSGQWFFQVCGQLFQVTDRTIDRDAHPARMAWMIEPSPVGSIHPSRWNVLELSNTQKLDNGYIQLLDIEMSGKVLVSFNQDDGTPCLAEKVLVRCWNSNIDSYRHPYYIYHGFVYPNDKEAFTIKVEHTIHDYLLVETEVTDRSVELIAQSVPLDLWYGIEFNHPTCALQGASPIVFEKTMENPWFFMVYLDAILFYTGGQ